MRIAIIGAGNVGATLGRRFADAGHVVIHGVRSPDDSKHAGIARDGVTLDTIAGAVASADVAILATTWAAAQDAVRAAGNFGGKVLIDATNPIADAPPQDGVLRFFTNLDESLMERLQAQVPGARFVKAFSCVGNAFMVNPSLPGGPPTMFICGNDADAKAVVRSILDQFGWDTADMGTATAARAIEPLCMLWCIPGLRGGGWSHAFKLLRG